MPSRLDPLKLCAASRQETRTASMDKRIDTLSSDNVAVRDQHLEATPASAGVERALSA
jgi:hypothetical protein